MICVSIMYPNTPGSTFNLRYYLDVHMPVAIGLMQQGAVAPVRMEILANGQGLDGTAASAPYHCVSNLYFKTREEADKLLAVLGSEEAVRLLVADWPNYTQADPVAQISLCQDIDPAGPVATANDVSVETDRARVENT